VNKQEGNRSVFLGAVAVAIVPKLIEGAVDSAALALKKAGERAELAQSTGRTISRPYMVTQDADLKVSDEHRCLIVSRGHFPQPVESQEGTIASLTDIEDRVFTFEAKVQHLNGEPYFQLVPYRLRTGKFEGSSFWSPRKREYSVAITMAMVGSDKPFASTVFTFEDVPENDDWNPKTQASMRKKSVLLALPPLPDSGKKAQAKQEAFIAPYVLAEYVIQAKSKSIPPTVEQPPSPLDSDAVRIATNDLCAKIKIYNKNYPKTPASDPQCSREITIARAKAESALLASQTPDALIDWAGRVCPSPIIKGKDKTISCGVTLVVPVKPDARFGQMVVDISVIEARDGNKFAAFLGEAIGSAKQGLVKAAEQQIIPSQKKALEEAGDAADRTAHRGVILADLAVTQSEQQLAELQATDSPTESSITAARALVIKAKIAANDAYRTADLPLPFPELG
jgi:hypothetical protein